MLQQMESILAKCLEVPKDFTYLGIGSAAHDPPEQITDAWDQVLPVFIMELLRDTKKTLRVIHFDPRFVLDDLTRYFILKKLKLSLLSEDETGWVWSNKRIEVIISKLYLYHTSEDWFLRDLAKEVLRTDGQLVVQEFSGQELGETFKWVYSEIEPIQKKLFKKKIIFDITFGEACHCMTDMSKYKPLYTPDGSFYNFTLYTSREMKEHVGLSKQIDTIIFTYFHKLYKEILNRLHLTYRRNARKLENATDEDPDEVMMKLQTEISELFPIFRALHVLTPEKETFLQQLFMNYREHDMYKWYNMVNNLLQQPAH